MASLEEIRHSLAHLLAAAVLEKFPGTKLGIGPTIEHGFYYDFDLPYEVKLEDLAQLEERMRELIAQKLKFERAEMSTAEAKKFLRRSDQPYKVELVEDFEKQGLKTVSFYNVGDFLDLCRGGHVKNTSEITQAAFKLTKIAGAYWRGDEARPQLTRIYGAAFKTERQLQDHLTFLEEAERRDHRRLGRELELFEIIEDEVGPGLVLWLPKGAKIRRILEDYWLSLHEQAGYTYVYTPHIGQLKLWKRSGHFDYYSEFMFPPMRAGAAEYLLKPMNCPFHIAIFKAKTRSWREMPVKLCEFGTVYRAERAGVLHGLMRVRGLTQDDAHIFAAEDQIAEVISEIIELVKKILRDCGFERFEIDLSVRDPQEKKKYVGDEQLWQQSEKTLNDLLKKKKLPFRVAPGEAKFYGPAIDFRLIDALGRSWQGPTIQIDYNLPLKFDLSYMGPDGQEHRPVMIHRALFGSMERFLGILLEHTGGNLPLWLAPVQVRVLPLSEKFVGYAKKVVSACAKAGLRTALDDTDETLPKRIRKAEIEKIPSILVVGEKEEKAGAVAVREQGRGDRGRVKLGTFIEELAKRALKPR